MVNISEETLLRVAGLYKSIVIDQGHQTEEAIYKALLKRSFTPDAAELLLKYMMAPIYAKSSVPKPNATNAPKTPSTNIPTPGSPEKKPTQPKVGKEAKKPSVGKLSSDYSVMGKM